MLRSYQLGFPLVHYLGGHEIAFNEWVVVAINRRRAASSLTSRTKKLAGHKFEDDFAKLIDGTVIKGVQKGDVIDQLDFQYSVKSGKKWQVFLYGEDRIQGSNYLKILNPNLQAFPNNPEIYFLDRIKCIEYKENYVKKHGREAAKLLTNEEVISQLGYNVYVESKNNLASASMSAVTNLQDKTFLRNFLSEAIFNGREVTYLAVQSGFSGSYPTFSIFHIDDVLDILTIELSPSISSAGKVPEDFNVAGQKVLLRYENAPNKLKNLVEIEIRNDSSIHFKQVRFNMYSQGALYLLTKKSQLTKVKSENGQLIYYGKASTLQD